MDGWKDELISMGSRVTPSTMKSHFQSNEQGSFDFGSQSEVGQ